MRGERLQSQSLESQHPVPRPDLVRRPRAAALDASRSPAVRDEAGAIVAPAGGRAYIEKEFDPSSSYLLHLLPASISER